MLGLSDRRTDPYELYHQTGSPTRTWTSWRGPGRQIIKKTSPHINILTVEEFPMDDIWPHINIIPAKPQDI